MIPLIAGGIAVAAVGYSVYKLCQDEIEIEDVFEIIDGSNTMEDKSMTPSVKIDDTKQNLESSDEIVKS